MSARPTAHIIVVQDGQILFLRRGPTAPWAPGKWGLPGGHIEPGETPAQGAVRELAEEAGIDPPYHLSYLCTLPKLTGGPMFLFRVERPAIYPFMPYCRDGEHDDFAWLDPDEINTLDLAPSVALFLSAAFLAAARHRA